MAGGLSDIMSGERWYIPNEPRRVARTRKAIFTGPNGATNYIVEENNTILNMLARVCLTLLMKSRDDALGFLKVPSAPRSKRRNVQAVHDNDDEEEDEFDDEGGDATAETNAYIETVYSKVMEACPVGDNKTLQQCNAAALDVSYFPVGDTPRKQSEQPRSQKKAFVNSSTLSNWIKRVWFDWSDKREERIIEPPRPWIDMCAVAYNPYSIMRRACTNAVEVNVAPSHFGSMSHIIAMHELYSKYAKNNFLTWKDTEFGQMCAGIRDTYSSNKLVMAHSLALCEAAITAMIKHSPRMPTRLRNSKPPDEIFFESFDGKQQEPPPTTLPWLLFKARGSQQTVLTPALIVPDAIIRPQWNGRHLYVFEFKTRYGPNAPWNRPDKIHTWAETQIIREALCIYYAKIDPSVVQKIHKKKKDAVDKYNVSQPEKVFAVHIETWVESNDTDDYVWKKGSIKDRIKVTINHTEELTQKKACIAAAITIIAAACNPETAEGFFCDATGAVIPITKKPIKLGRNGTTAAHRLCSSDGLSDDAIVAIYSLIDQNLVNYSPMEFVRRLLGKTMTQRFNGKGVLSKNQLKKMAARGWTWAYTGAVVTAMRRRVLVWLLPPA